MVPSTGKRPRLPWLPHKQVCSALIDNSTSPQAHGLGLQQEMVVTTVDRYLQALRGFLHHQGWIPTHTLHKYTCSPTTSNECLATWSCFRQTHFAGNIVTWPHIHKQPIDCLSPWRLLLRCVLTTHIYYMYISTGSARCERSRVTKQAYHTTKQCSLTSGNWHTIGDRRVRLDAEVTNELAKSPSFFSSC